MENIRQLRANEEVLKAVDNIIKNKMNDPRLHKFITLTYANVSNDFRHAKIGVSVYNSNANDVLKQLTKSEGYIKRELMQVVRLPYAPKLVFVLDDGAEHSDRINEILSTLTIPHAEEEDENEEID